MTYFYEQLDPERFQQFAQALILIDQPNLQCLPVAQPDGGRDAFQLSFFPVDGSRELAVYQVKFVRDPASIEDPHKWLVQQMASEAPKIANLLPHGVKNFYLITNLKGTSHLDRGSIDQLQAVLDDSMPVPAMAWWRDDLDRRLEKAPTRLKWAYPDLMRGTDVLDLLIDSDLRENRRRRADVLRAFVAEQYEMDEEVRFKQVELQNDLLSLFVDVPAVITRGPNERKIRFAGYLSESGYRVHAIEVDQNRAMTMFMDDQAEAAGAAALLLDEQIQQLLPFAVIEGAPGQGKSTLAQFVCQMYRMQLRGTNFASVSEQHRPRSARLPVKVDLPEYAVWQSGRDPFAEDEDAARVVRSSERSLESFIAALISDTAGGAEFTVADLHAVLGASRMLIVLDGLDEIAETKRRDNVIKEINSAARRLRELSPDIQVVVTTRPSAFAGVAEFSPRVFHHMTLVRLTPSLITNYAMRWTSAKRISSREAAAIRKSLRSRLTQPHVRDLATNPMQLAILLSVIHSRGSSLPDKRTALYDIYVELFLAREAEKTREVREHSDLLVDVHRYLAYVLHARAEAENRLGRVGYDELMEILRRYLESEMRDPRLADELFAGAQRVVFLVARVEGTFEFEVQPLREYFAGKYLYETSAYSPAGNEQPGTMPDRFDVLSRNPYWLNVTRFFAGSLSKGELPALVERLENLAEDDDYMSISHPRYLAATLLADWVFSQHQKSVQRVVSLVLDGPGLRALVRNNAQSRQDIFTLPSGAGRAELLEGAFDAIDAFETRSESFVALANMLNANANQDELTRQWRPRYEAAEDPDARRKWFSVAYHLGLLRTFEPSEVAAMVTECGGHRAAQYLLRANCVSAIQADDRMVTLIIEGAIDGHYKFNPRNLATDVEHLLLPFSEFWYQSIFSSSAPSGYPARELMDRMVRPTMSGKPNRRGAVHLLDTGSRAVLGRIEPLLAAPMHDWRTSIEPWSELVSAAADAWGDDRFAVRQTAIVSSLVKDGLKPTARQAQILDDGVDVCTRLRAARLRAGNVQWWRKQLSTAATTTDVELVVAALMFTAGPSSLVALIGDVDRLLDKLSDGQFERLVSLQTPNVGYLPHWAARNKIDVTGLPNELTYRAVCLLGMVVPVKVQRGLRNRYLHDYYGNSQAVKTFLVELAIADIVDQGSGNDGDRWSSLVRAVRLPGIRNPGLLRLGRYAWGEAQVMPIALAREIVGDPELPDGLLALAERVCELHTFESCPPLVEVAERDRWFANL